MSFFQNACKPQGLGGTFFVNTMNIGHAAVSKWGLGHLTIRPTDNCLDLGCGGGANVKRLLELAPQGQVKAVDYSQVSVDKTKDLNSKAIQAGRCMVMKGNVMDLLFAKKYFNVVTAFETVYFWPDLRKAFREVHNVLADDGVFLICNETDGSGPSDSKWTEKIQGMTIYTAPQLEALLREAGFTQIQTDRTDKHWLAVVARK